tara:strand:+ start:1261 stop:1494 length:234 start_codon:yes stop_codon:yes gene_type:complete
MIQNLILMNGYGFFVWSSFAITFLVCVLVFYKTRKTLRKYEKEFVKEINELSAEKRKLAVESSKITSQVLSSYSKTI